MKRLRRSLKSETMREAGLAKQDHHSPSGLSSGRLNATQVHHGCQLPTLTQLNHQLNKRKLIILKKIDQTLLLGSYIFFISVQLLRSPRATDASRTERRAKTASMLNLFVWMAYIHYCVVDVHHNLKIITVQSLQNSNTWLEHTCGELYLQIQRNNWRPTTWTVCLTEKIITKLFV